MLKKQINANINREIFLFILNQGQYKKVIKKFLILISSISYTSILTFNNFLLAEIIDKDSITKSEENFIQSDFQKSYYLIGPGDVITLNIYAHPEFSGIYNVLPDGSVTLPLVGTIFLETLNLNEARKLLEKEFSTQILRPELNITIKQERPVKVSLVGEVKRPGIYSLTTKEQTLLNPGQPTKISGNPRLLDAIQQAGGITSNANLKEVQLIRRYSSSGEKKVANLNLIEVITKGDQDYNPIIFDGDIIKIPKADQLPENIITLAESNLSPATISVSVIGSVKSPGIKQLKTNSTITQAVLIAGGPIEWNSSKGNIELVRILRNGTISRKKFNFNSKKISDNYPKLSDGDIVFVKSNALGKTTKALKAITDPISSIITGVSLYKILSD